jgi:hypothetical protein
MRNGIRDAFGQEVNSAGSTVTRSLANYFWALLMHGGMVLIILGACEIYHVVRVRFSPPVVSSVDIQAPFLTITGPDEKPTQSMERYKCAVEANQTAAVLAPRTCVSAESHHLGKDLAQALVKIYLPKMSEYAELSRCLLYQSSYVKVAPKLQTLLQEFEDTMAGLLKQNKGEVGCAIQQMGFKPLIVVAESGARGVQEVIELDDEMEDELKDEKIEGLKRDTEKELNLELVKYRKLDFAIETKGAMMKTRAANIDGLVEIFEGKECAYKAQYDYSAKSHHTHRHERVDQHAADPRLGLSQEKEKVDAITSNNQDAAKAKLSNAGIGASV